MPRPADTYQTEGEVLQDFLKSEYLKDKETLHQLESTVDEIIANCANLDAEELEKLAQWAQRTRPDDPIWPGLDRENQAGLTDSFLSSSLISELTGLLFGRWLHVSESSEAEASTDGLVSFYPPIFNRNRSAIKTEQGKYWDTKDILVDDGSDSSDFEGCISQVLHALYGDNAGVVEAFLLHQLKVRSIREYLSVPNGFFADHLRKSCKTLRNVWYMSACNGILTGHEAKQP